MQDLFFCAARMHFFLSDLLQRPHRRQAAICVSSYCCMCVLTSVSVYCCMSSYCHIRVLILRHVSSYCYVCVLILPYVLIMLYTCPPYCGTCPHTAVYVSSYCCMCPHTAMCALCDLVHSTQRRMGVFKHAQIRSLCFGAESESVPPTSLAFELWPGKARHRARH